MTWAQEQGLRLPRHVLLEVTSAGIEGAMVEQLSPVSGNMKAQRLLDDSGLLQRVKWPACYAGLSVLKASFSFTEN